MFELKYAEFYITNVCNLTCEQCNRYNNHKFKGFYNFDLESYRQWSTKVNLKIFSILGGEPTLNPNLVDWLDGIRECWPQAYGEVVTNGTYLSRVAELHQALARNRINVNICIHNVGMREYVASEIFQAFGDCQIVDIECNNPNSAKYRIKLKTDLGVYIMVDNGGRFHNNVFSGPNFGLHNSDRARAHQVCTMKHCHHFIDAKLYKCGMVGILPEFFEQQNLPVPALLKEYQPLTIETVTDQGIKDLDNSISQCQLCPEKLVYRFNQADFKNPRLNFQILKKDIPISSR